MTWLFYLLEANLYLLIFYGFYCLLLRHETFYSSNRYYLLTTSLISFLLPILQLGWLKPVPVAETIAYTTSVVYNGYTTTAPTEEPINFITYLYPIYLLVATGFALKLGVEVAKIISIWFSAKKRRLGKITVIELKVKAAFSFFNLLFLHPNLAEKKAVLNHEMVHINQGHSFDILFFEILKIVCWFNPIIYFIQKDIKLLHEYIADELSADTDMQKHDYAMFLIENSFGIMPNALTNQIFNQSILKSRINMLNKKRTAGWARLKLLLAFPLVCGMLCASTVAFTKDYGYLDLLPEKSGTVISMIQDPPQATESTKKVPLKMKSEKKIAGEMGKTEKFFSPTYRLDNKTGKEVLVEKRLIVINGTAIADLNKFYGVKNASEIKFINPGNATKKYGDRAKFGAVEITGKEIKYFKTKLMPPPQIETVKFPLPIAKKDKMAQLRTMESLRLLYTTDSVRRLHFETKPDQAMNRNVNRDSVQNVRLRLVENRAVQRTNELNGSILKLDSVRTINLKLRKPLKKEIETIRLKEVPRKPSGATNYHKSKAREVSPKLTEIVLIPTKLPTANVVEIPIATAKP